MCSNTLPEIFLLKNLGFFKLLQSLPVSKDIRNCTRYVNLEKLVN